ncbi:hypothetical protein [Scytonema sp. PCC 10023]
MVRYRILFGTDAANYVCWQLGNKQPLTGIAMPMPAAAIANLTHFA